MRASLSAWEGSKLRSDTGVCERMYPVRRATFQACVSVRPNHVYSVPMLTVTVFSIAAGLARLPRSRAARLHCGSIANGHSPHQLPASTHAPYSVAKGQAARPLRAAVWLLKFARPTPHWRSSPFKGKTAWLRQIPAKEARVVLRPCARSIEYTRVQSGRRAFSIQLHPGSRWKAGAWRGLKLTFGLSFAEEVRKVRISAPSQWIATASVDRPASV